MRSKLLSTMVAASLALPLAAAAADNVTYSSADLAYVTTDIAGVDEDLDGFALRGSLEVTEQAFIFCTYADQTAESGGVDVDYTNFTLGGGYAQVVEDTVRIHATTARVAIEARTAAHH